MITDDTKPPPQWYYALRTLPGGRVLADKPYRLDQVQAGTLDHNASEGWTNHGPFTTEGRAHRSLVGRLRKLGAMRHYDAIAAAAAARGWPTSFAADLTVHDLATCASYGPDLPFLFALRSCGTHTIHPAEEGSREHRNGAGHAKLVATLRDAFSSESLFYWWDGVGLRTVTDREAVDLLDETSRAMRQASEAARRVA